MLENFQQMQCMNDHRENKTTIFLYQACFSPPISTWIEAIKQSFFATYPVLTVDIVNKYLPKSEHTVKGHMCQTFKNKISTNFLEKSTTIPSEDPSEKPKENPSKHQAMTLHYALL